MGSRVTLIYIVVPKSTKYLAATVPVRNVVSSLKFNVSKVVEFSAPCEPFRYLLLALYIFCVSGACPNRCFPNKNSLWVPPWAPWSTRLDGLLMLAGNPQNPSVQLRCLCLAFMAAVLKNSWEVRDLLSGAHVKQREFKRFLSSDKLGFVLENLC